MATYPHNHIGANSPTRIDLSDYGGGLLMAIKVADRGGAATVDVDETGGLGRKLVDLASSTTTTTVYWQPETTDNTGTGQSTFVPAYLDSPLEVTSSEDCTVYIQVI